MVTKKRLRIPTAHDLPPLASKRNALREQINHVPSSFQSKIHHSLASNRTVNAATTVLPILRTEDALPALSSYNRYCTTL